MVDRELFGRISEISLEDESSWRGRIFLTLDTDWAHDEVIAYAADRIEAHGVAATWFVTHATPILNRLRANSKFELGIHPNFNFLLAGDSRNGTSADDVLDRMLLTVPEATAVRSHSMAQSSSLLNLFQSRGLTHDCNHFVPDSAQIELKPWRIWNGIVKVPHSWEDDLHCITAGGTSPAEITARRLFCVLDFHPIHVFLNTDSVSRYNVARGSFHDPGMLEQYRNSDSPGVTDMFDQVLNATRALAADSWSR